MGCTLVERRAGPVGGAGSPAPPPQAVAAADNASARVRAIRDVFMRVLLFAREASAVEHVPRSGLFRTPVFRYLKQSAERPAPELRRQPDQLVRPRMVDPPDQPEGIGPEAHV